MLWQQQQGQRPKHGWHGVGLHNLQHKHNLAPRTSSVRANRALSTLKNNKPNPGHKRRGDPFDQTDPDSRPCRQHPDSRPYRQHTSQGRTCDAHSNVRSRLGHSLSGIPDLQHLQHTWTSQQCPQSYLVEKCASLCLLTTTGCCCYELAACVCVADTRHVQDLGTLRNATT
jgi:hypothetical protein